MKKTIAVALCGVAITLGGALEGYGANLAQDNAGNYSNDSNAPNFWQTGATLGTGFGAWTNVSNSGAAYLNEYNSPATIGTGPTNNVFDIFSNFGQFPTPGRDFTGGNLTTGQSFTIQFDLGNTLNSGGGTGFTINSSNQDNVGNFNANFDLNTGFLVAGSQNLTSINLGVLQGGVTYTFTLTSPSTYAFTAASLDNSVSETITGSGVDALNGFLVYAYGTGDNNDVFFNNFSVAAVPEPSTTGILVMGALIVVLVVRHRQQAQKLS